MRLVLLIVAIVAFLIAALISHGNITSDQYATWIAGGLATFAGSFLPFEDWKRG